jgi:hypothetical protein
VPAAQEDQPGVVNEVALWSQTMPKRQPVRIVAPCGSRRHARPPRPVCMFVFSDASPRRMSRQRRAKAEEQEMQCPKGLQGSRGPMTDSVHSISLTCQHSLSPERAIDLKTPCFPLPESLCSKNSEKFYRKFFLRLASKPGLSFRSLRSTLWGLWSPAGPWRSPECMKCEQSSPRRSALRHPTDTATPAAGPNQACAQLPTASSGLATANQGVAIFALARCTKQHATAPKRYKQGGGGNSSAVLCPPWQSLPWAFGGGVACSADLAALQQRICSVVAGQRRRGAADTSARPCGSCGSRVSRDPDS